MRKLLLILVFAITSVIAFGQAAPTANMRIANATTAFGVNIPVGFIVYDYGDDKLYMCKAATASTLTLTTGSANFGQISLGAAHLPVTINATANGLSVDGSQVLTLATANTSTTGALTGTDWTTFNNKQTATLTNGNILVGNVSNVATSVSMSGDATISNTGAVTVSNAASNMRVGGVLKIVGTTTGSASDSLLTVNGGTVKKVASSTYQTSTLTNGNILVGNGSNVAASVTMSADASISNTGAVTVANSAVIGKVLTGYTSGAGTVAATDNILQAVQKLNGNQVASAATIHQAIVEDYEVAIADSASTGHYYYALAHTPLTGTIQIQVNGVATKLYTVQATSKIRTGFSLGQYDKLQVLYSY